jgi:hypothetical protein
MRPPEVQRFVDRATEESAPAAVTGYLARLTAFVEEQEPLRDAPEGERESITFILGHDPAGAANPFYRAAEAFYRLHPAGTLVPARDLTDRAGGPVLRDVRDYLAAHRPANGRPWGEVNVVVHANEEGGMSVPARPLTPQEAQQPDVHNATPIALQAALDAGEFDALDDETVDVRTTIQIRGCALGRSQDMLHMLSVAFGGNEPRRPTVRAPRHLQAYSYGPPGWNPLGAAPPADAEDLYVEFWMVGYPTRHRPTNAVLVARFQAAYPGVAVDWAYGITHPGTPSGDRLVSETREREYTYGYRAEYRPIPTTAAQLTALVRAAVQGAAGATNVVETARSAPDASGQVEIDVEYDVGGDTYTNSITTGPNPPRSDAERRALIEADPETVADMDRIGHVIADYDWNFREDDDPAANGLRVYTMEAEGSHTILRVERELREPDPARPGHTRRMHPDVTDQDHFGEEVPVRPPAQPLGQNVTFP